MDTPREPIIRTRTVSALLLVLCTLAYSCAVAVGMSLALRAIQSLVSVPYATTFWRA